jgi:CO/xanthine dehydrogenase FAD-binding subunit
MAQSDITAASSIGEALSWLDEYGPNGGVILAGGTDLFVGWSKGIPKPQHLLYIGGLGDYKKIELRSHKLVIGPLTPMADIAKSPVIRDNAPALAKAAGAMGSPLIRERATVGGNLCHASPAADTAAPLLVLGATIELQSVKGTRRIPLEEFFTAPGQTAKRTDELMTRIIVPIDSSRRDFYLRLGQRQSLACVKVSVSGSAIIRNSHYRDVRIALGAVAPVPMLARVTMAILENKEWSSAIVEGAANSAMSECDPIDDIRSTIEYRRAMVGVLLKQGLEVIQSNPNG